MGKWRKNLVHDYAVANRAFPLKSAISSHAINQLTGSQHLQVEQVVVKLHKNPCPNLNVIIESVKDIFKIFWMEYKNFQSNRFPFAHPGRFLTKDAYPGCSHI